MPVLYNAHSVGVTVGLTLTFATAPADLHYNNLSLPQDVRACEAMNANIRKRPGGKLKRKHLDCATSNRLPLIISGSPDKRLIVRP